MFVPVTTPVFRLLEPFRAQRKEVAIVLDEYGGVEGIASMSDILSGLVGARPADGQLGETPVIVRNRDGTWTADGRVDIEDVQDALGIWELGDQPHSRYRTLAGFIMTRSGRIPLPGSTVSAAGFDFHVETTEGRRIDQVRIERRGAFDELRNTRAKNPDSPRAAPD